MDEHELAQRAGALPERFADRLTATDLDLIAGARDGGEWAVVVDDLTATLAANATPVTAAERNELRDLMDAMNMPTDVIGRLNVTRDHG